MYTEKVKKEMKEMKELLDRANRISEEAKLYNGEEAEPMLYNIEKIKDQYNEKKGDMLARYEVTKKQLDEGFKKRVDLLKENFENQKKSLEEPFNKKIEELNVRIERLKNEKAIYEKDGNYNEAIQNNIDRLEEEIRVLNETEGKQIKTVLQERENNINSKIEETKKRVNTRMETVRKDLAEMGIDVEEYKLGEEDKKQEEPEVEQEEPEVKQEEPEVEQKEPEMEQKGPEVEQEEPEMEQKGPEVEQEEPEMKQKGPEVEQEEPEVKQKSQYAPETIPNVAIRYLAKTDEYELIDQDKNERYVYARTELNPIDKEMISERMDIPMENLKNMNSDIVRILRDFDKINGTHKLSQYRRAIIQTDLTKQDMKEEMYSAGIKIDYNLKGLYKKGAYTPEEIQGILQNANNAKQVGSGSVKKGIHTIVREKIEKVVNKIKNTKLLDGKITKNLPEPEEMDEYIAEKTNREYWNSIDEKAYKKAINKAHDDKTLREKLQLLKAEQNFEKMMNPTKEKWKKEAERRESLHMHHEPQPINHEEAIKKVEGETLTSEEVKEVYEEQEK